jgi:hypothetical protein
MDRRTFLATVAGGLLAAPLAAEAQPAGKVYRIGVLMNLYPPDATRLRLFAKGFGTSATSKDRTS